MRGHVRKANTGRSSGERGLWKYVAGKHAPEVPSKHYRVKSEQRGHAVAEPETASRTEQSRIVSTKKGRSAGEN